MRALLLILLLVPAAFAQTQVLTDDAGDATATLADTTAPGIDPRSFDLLGLLVDETDAVFRFTLQVTEIDPPNPTLTDAGQMDVDFSHGDADYRLRLHRNTHTGANEFAGYFMPYDPGRGQYVYDQQLQTTIDGSEETATLEVPRDWLLDGNGTAPTAGRLLTAFSAASGNQQFFNPGVVAPLLVISDRMPDTGAGPRPYVVTVGLAQEGDAFLESAIPFRASNGEKATFVYTVSASNLGTQETRFSLTLEDVPPQWEVTLPGQAIRLAGNESRTFPVLVAVPFAHQHGAADSFILQMQDPQDPGSIGRLELGVRYLEVPQPAGHHDRLHIHTAAAQDASTSPAGLFKEAPARAYFNTVEDHENDDDTGVPPFGGSIYASPVQGIQWEMWLEPGLQMGLDFDLDRTGEMTVQFSDTSGLHAAALDGYMEHIRVVNMGEDVGFVRTTVATIPRTGPQPLGAATSFDAEIRPAPGGDLVPFAEQAALRMVLNLTFEQGVPPAGAPGANTFLLGGTFTLPLNEYRDALGDVVNTLAGLKFSNAGPMERLVNPGETVLFNLTVANEGAVDDAFVLRANGTNAAWARVLGDAQVFVPAGTSRPVVVALSPPADAPNGDIADLIITAASVAEPSIQGNIRVVAVVDTSLDHPDESHLVDSLSKQLATPQEAPGLPILAVLLSWACVVAAQRRGNGRA